MLYHRTIEIEYYEISVLHHLVKFNVFTSREKIKENLGILWTGACRGLKTSYNSIDKRLRAILHIHQFAQVFVFITEILYWMWS